MRCTYLKKRSWGFPQYRYSLNGIGILVFQNMPLKMGNSEFEKTKALLHEKTER